MKKLTKKQQQTIKKAKEIISTAKLMTPRIKEQLKALGFYQADLGTGQSSYTTSKSCKIMTPDWIKKEVFVIGIANASVKLRRRPGFCVPIYKGMVLDL